ncbi:hypothetical protein [Methanoregula sp.]|uniref:hypothetical protein n=1 Tax=Methanoregula sp. TaxID=2052170 RepID=UPI003566AFB3
MLDTKTSCLLRGILGVIFGFLALMLPDIIIGAFYGFFWILIGLGMAVFLFLAITSRNDEATMWFGLAAVLLVLGVVSFVFPGFVALLFILIVAGIAIYNGFNDITIALTHPKTKYILIPAMILTGVAFLAVLFYYFPGFEKNLFLSIVGTFALIFGLYSIVLGYYKSESSDEPEPAVLKNAVCTFGKNKENK